MIEKPKREEGMRNEPIWIYVCPNPSCGKHEIWMRPRVTIPCCGWCGYLMAGSPKEEGQ